MTWFGLSIEFVTHTPPSW